MHELFSMRVALITMRNRCFGIEKIFSWAWAYSTRGKLVVERGSGIWSRQTGHRRRGRRLGTSQGKWIMRIGGGGNTLSSCA